MSSLERAKEKLEQLKDLYCYRFFASTEEKTNRIRRLYEEIEAELISASSDKATANEVIIIRGRALNYSDEYNPVAEELLSKAVKLFPSNADCWTALGNCLWKKGDKETAYTCFVESINQQPTVDALCEASIAIRQVGTEKSADVDESVSFAKRAISLDMTNQKAWYTLGNALVAKYFLSRLCADADKALKAYKKSQSLIGGDVNPDLFYNRGGILSHLLNFDAARDDFARSVAIDGSLAPQVEAANTAIMSSVERLKRLLTLQMFANSEQIAKSRRELGESSLSHTAEPFANLAAGSCLGRLFASKIVTKEATPKDAPAQLQPPFYLLCVDAQGKFGIVALYDVGSDLALFVPGATVVIADPDVVVVDLSQAATAAVGAGQSVAKQCMVVRMNDRTKMRIDGLQLGSTDSAAEANSVPSVVSEVF